MLTMSGFTRQEASDLTGVTIDRLVYLDRIGLIEATRFGTGKRKIVLYSWNQLIQMVILKHYKDRYGADQMVRILNFIKESATELRLGDRVAIFNNATGGAIIDEREHIADLVEKAHGIELKHDPKEVFDLSILPPMKVFVDEILENAKKSTMISEDDQRLKNQFQFSVV